MSGTNLMDRFGSTRHSCKYGFHGEKRTAFVSTGALFTKGSKTDLRISKDVYWRIQDWQEPQSLGSFPILKTSNHNWKTNKVFQSWEWKIDWHLYGLNRKFAVSIVIQCILTLKWNNIYLKCHHFEMEQYIPYSLLCDLFSRNLETNLHSIYQHD